MSAIETKVKLAQRRLWLNRWLGQWGWSLAAALSLWLLAWIVNRLFGLYPWPIWTTLGSAGAMSLIASIVWLVLTRDPMLAAATALDQAAGLRERISTGLMLPHDATDSFEAAVVRDANERASALTPRKFLPLRWPGSLSIGSLITVAALLSLLLPEFDLLNRKEINDQHAAQAGLQSRSQAVLANAAAAIDKIAEENKVDVNATASANPMNLKMPQRTNTDFKRRETIKKLNRLQDALKQKIGSEKFEALKETKKRLRQLGEQGDPKSELSELISALAAGDFGEAQKSVRKLQEKLAKRAAEGGAKSDDVQKMQQQLKDLAARMKDVAQAAQQKQQEQQSRDLQNAGLSKEDAKRVLEQLSKKDPKQIEKLAQELAQRLKDKGVTREQMKKMLDKMQKQMKASEKANGQCNKMGDKMNQAAKQMKKGDMEQAEKELDETGESLSEMEQLEQTLNEIESQMSELDQVGEEMEEDYDSSMDDLECKACHGTGFRPDGAPCPKCNGAGQCGGRGRGSGNRERDDSADTSTVNRRAKTKFGRGGGIVGQQFVKDKQLKGQSSAEASDASAAEEIDDTDAIERERIPRAYRKSVKRFFDRGDQDDAEEDAGDEKDTDEKDADESKK